MTTFSAEELVSLLDEAMTSGDWHNIRIFSTDTNGQRETVVSMGRNPVHYTVDLLGPSARPSEKLLWLLRDNLRRGSAAAPETTPSDPMADLLDDI